MDKIRRWLGRQTGQSIAIVAVALVAMVSMAGLVVDVGNAYALQRKVRNAVDAAALAGARELAAGETTTNAQVLQAVRRYAQMNQVSQDNITVWYCGVDDPDNPHECNPLQAVNNDGFSPPTEIDGVEVAGVMVEGRASVSTYLAHIVGIHSFNAAESSTGWALCGVCSAGSGEGLFPAVIPVSAFDHNDGHPAFSQTYRFFEGAPANGNFGWVAWDDDPGHTSQTTLEANIEAALNGGNTSGVWSVSEDPILPGSTGRMSSSAVRQLLQQFVDSGKPFTIPVYEVAQGQGQNHYYNIVGFVRMQMTGFDTQGQDRYIEGIVLNGTEPSGEGDCADLGICVIKLRPSIEERRSITGVVSVWQPRLTEGVVPSTEHIPVDVVNVLDISGSMNDRWGPGREVKLTTAKRVLTEFNGYLMPEEGDQAGLVTFPRIVRGSYYPLTCSSSWSRDYYLGQVRSSLTSNINSINSIINTLSANGGTPLAAGVQLGRGEVIPEGARTPGRVPVLIIATDGLANCTIDGRWTGFSGTYYDSLPCNALADQHALEQANMAKQAGVIVFTIAIGDSFNTSLLQSMATEDTDPTKPHFFLANSQEDLEAIYQSIAVRVNDIGSECQVEEFETTGDYAVVSIYKDGQLYDQTTASASGSYVFPDVDPGEYTFAVSLVKDGLTFDILTDMIGGPAAEEPIVLTVEERSGTYVRDLYLRTSTPLRCE